ncbi:YciK family oxidoreductase [Vibrio sp. 11986-1-5]|uniref:YciK family oxidoreductase n=1 Tax=Vibrio sp. 11986-1-5 TaxID=2211215 RepID=UPI000D72E1CC|nr:YciK family oxidoreductase [Vibrio sp. 11986-1-5]PXA70994.1 YciK family oxidoreductase [Vibrio sp. 11986-1-5]
MNYSVAVDALQDKVILVTGASDGIGKQAAITYAAHGARVILLGRSEDKLQQTYDEIINAGYPQALAIPLDMQHASKNDYQALMRKIEQQCGQLDGLLHSAGLLGDISPFEAISEHTYDQVMQVNVKAQLLLTQAALPLIKRSPQGRVVFTSSTVGHSGRSGWASYSISKFATEGMMQILADELRDTPLRVNAINPGGTRTAMRAKAYPQEDANRLKTPQEIMPLYLYLMARESQHVHGQCIDAQPK